jgi:hypothetical protein
MANGMMIGPIYIQLQDLWLTSLAFLLIFPLGWQYGYQLARKGLNLDTAFEKGGRKWFFLIGFLGICGLISLIYKFPHLLNPWILGYLEPAAWVAAKGGALFLAGMAYPLAKGGKKADLYALYGLALIATLGIQGLQGYFLRPIAQNTIFKRISTDGSILQSTNVTCTAAAFANALKLYGIQATEKEVARIFGTRDTGTSQIQLLNGIRHYGLFGHYVSVLPKHLARMNRPAMISIDLHVITHSILAYAYDSLGNILIIDPVSGKGKYTPEHFQKQLKEFSGVVLTNAPLPEVNLESPAFILNHLETILRNEGYLDKSIKLNPSNFKKTIAAFQSKWQIPVTGRVDTQTWLLLTGPEQNNFEPRVKKS